MSRADLAKLLALQDLDTSIDRHRHRQANLPERAELAAIDAEAAALRPQITEATAARDDVAGRQAALEAELAATEERAAAVNKRLYGGEVSASRELSAMAADVESLKARASALEDRVLELLEEAEPLDGRLADLQTRATTLAGRRQEVADALAAAEAVVAGELAETEKARAAEAVGLPETLLSTYDRLRARLGGVGAARLVGDHCDGCHLKLPATELDRIRHLPDGEFVTCDQCGRILVRT